MTNLYQMPEGEWYDFTMSVHVPHGREIPSGWLDLLRWFLSEPDLGFADLVLKRAETPSSPEL